MRSSPSLSETRFSLSFFLTTPAKKPRTECCCQSVASMMAAIVVPFGCRSSLSTASCLEDPPVALSAACLELTALCATAVFPAPGFLAEERLDRSRLAMRLEDFGFDCLVAIWPLPRCQRQHHVLSPTQAPHRAGQEEGRETLGLP